MWFFNSPEIVYGEDALDYLDELRGRRAFIVTDAVLHRLGYTERVAEHLRKAGLEVAYFAEVEPEPSLETVARGVDALRAHEPDWIVGLGGGSPMDAAKAMWVRYERPDLSFEELPVSGNLGLGAKARMIAIPTTAGTGAEVTWQFVLSDTLEGRKVPSGARETVPTLAVVDPSLTASMPPRVTADTGLDVLSHAVEGYTSIWHNPFADGLCLKAIQMVFAHLPMAVADGSNLEARTGMAFAATLGGLAWGNSWVGLAHAMGHALGAVFHLPHGRSVAACLPDSIQFSAGSGARYSDIARLVGLPAGDELSAANSLAETIRNLMRRIAQPMSLAELGIDGADFAAQLERLCDLAENDLAMPMAVRIPNRTQLVGLFRCINEGRVVDTSL